MLTFVQFTISQLKSDKNSVLFRVISRTSLTPLLLRLSALAICPNQNQESTPALIELIFVAIPEENMLEGIEKCA